MNAEVKYRRIPIKFGQFLNDTSEYRFLRNEGWSVKWKYTRVMNGERVVETLLFREEKAGALA